MAKNFPVNSTSVTTPAVDRLIRVLRRAKIAEAILKGGVFNCRKTSGTSLWSAHARGDALDIFPVKADDIERIREAVITHCTKPTLANFGRPVKGIIFVVGRKTQWIRGQGKSPYPGISHDSHVHAAGSFSSPVKPPCAS